MFPFSPSSPAPDAGAQPGGAPATAASLPPLAPQPEVTPAAGEIPAGGEVQFTSQPAPDPALAPPAAPEAPLSVQGDAAAPAASPDAAGAAPDPVATFPAGDIADEVKTMTTKEAVKILRELLEIGEFQKVFSGAQDVLQVDPNNAEAQRLRDEAQTLMNNPEQVKRLQEAGRKRLQQRRIIVTTASVLMMAALGLEAWAMFGEQKVEAPPVEQIAYKVSIKTDPPEAQGEAPLTLTFNVRADIPPGVTVLFDSGDGAPKPPPYTRTFSTPGAYVVKAVATGPDGAQLSEDEQKVTVYAKLKVDITTVPGSSGDSLTVAFSSSVSGAANGGAPAYRWDFGDGRTDTAANPTHTYEAAGTYEAKLTVSLPDGSHGEATASVEVVAPELPTEIPTEIPTVPPVSDPPSSIVTGGAVDAVISTIPKSADSRTLSGAAPFTVLFSAGGSRSENGTVSSVHWDFGDSFDSDEWNSIHNYTQPGLYRVTLTVSDTSGVTGTEQLTVSVRSAASSAPPTTGPIAIRISTDVPAQGSAPLSISFDASGSTSTRGKITGYEWDFGDQSTLGSGARVSHVFQSTGKYSVKLTVTDDTGTAAQQVLTVTVS